MVKFTFKDNKAGSRFVRILREEEDGAYKDADGFVWHIRRGLDGNIVVVRSSCIKRGFEEGQRVFAREIKGIVDDRDRVINIELKATVDVDGDAREVGFTLWKDSVSDQYVLTVINGGSVFGEKSIELPEEMGIVFDSLVGEPELLLNVLEVVVSSEGFQNYVLERMRHY